MRVLGKGGAEILEAINRYGSIVAAARNLGMSYKFVWDYLIRMQKRLSQPVVITHRGGADRGKKKGGGGTVLTPVASNLLREFESTQRLIENALSNKNKMVKLQKVASRRGNLARPARKH
jgi:molybdate transport system regulatory protein